MKKTIRIISFVMVLLLVFSSMGVSNLVNIGAATVYAAEIERDDETSASPSTTAASVAASEIEAEEIVPLLELSVETTSGTVTPIIIANLHDEQTGSPLEGITVYFNTSFGVLDSISKTTDASGKAVVALSSDLAGTAVVNAYVNMYTNSRIEVQLSPEEEDQCLKADYEWLTPDFVLSGNDYTVQVYDGVNSYYGITSKLTMPKEGPGGSTISWASSDEEMVSLDGDVARPAYDMGMGSVVLTATLSNEEKKAARVFYIYVDCLDKTPEQEAVDADYNWLDDVLVGRGIYLSDFDGNELYFPLEGYSGSNISWESSDETVISADGTVSRPSFTQGNKEVIVTATISRGNPPVVKTKEFYVTVLALTPTNAEIVVADKAWLTSGLVLNGNSADDVKINLYLPVSGKYGSTISWQSSNADAVSTDGRVTRPGKPQGSIPVTLTATITRWDAEDVKTFDIVITPVEEYPLALKFDDFSNPGDSLQYNGESSIKDSVNSEGQASKVLHFINNNNGGSVFTKNKIHLSDDLSFSTAFSFRIKAEEKITLGNGGFTFTLQADDNKKYSQGSGSLGVHGIKPGISIEFDSKYSWDKDPYSQATWYAANTYTAAFVNGEYNNPITTDNYMIPMPLYTKIDGSVNYVWVEYDGLSKALEVRVSEDGLRPESPAFRLENIDLVNLLTSEDSLSIEDVQDLYAGFTGSAGDAGDEDEILNWYFKSDSTPIDFAPYDFIDASNITLSADPQGGQSSSTITASVHGAGSNSPAVGVPVYFSTTFGTLDKASAVTDSSGNASVKLSSITPGTAVITATAAGGAYAETEVQLVLSDDDRVAMDAQWLTDKIILNGNSSLDNVINDLNLPVSGINGSNISWSSSREDLVTADGKVTTPDPADGDQEVVLTATISQGSQSIEKEFNIMVKTLDNDIVSADSNWLTDELILNGNSDLDSIIKDLNLPGTGLHGSIITWASNDESVVKPDGKVARPSFIQGGRNITLTASIQSGTIKVDKVFNVTVKALDPTDAEAVAADSDWLVDELILNGNSALDSIIKDLNLPGTGKNGTTISWTSSYAGVISHDGKVARPGFIDGDARVTLTVVIFRGTESIEKKFEMVVKALDATDADIVDADKAWLDVSQTLGDNLSQYAICDNLSLPESGPNGSSIAWTSSMPEALSGSGTVTRPVYEEGHKYVTMTATIVKGIEHDTRVFEYTVLSMPDIVPPEIIACTPENNSTNVNYQTTEITVDFSENIKEGADWGKIALNTNNKYTKRIENNRFIITMASGRAFGYKYELTIPSNAITDLSGNPLKENFALYYTIEQYQNNKIEVISSSPYDGQTQVPIDTKISFSYGYNNIAGTFLNGIKLTRGDGLERYLQGTLNGAAVTLEIPKGFAKYGETYEISIPAGAVEDRYRNKSAAKTIRFRMQADGASPQISSTYPSDGQQGADIHQSIRAIFSEAVRGDCSDLRLSDDKGNIVPTIYRRINGNSSNMYEGLILEPVEPLKPQTKYTVLANPNSFRNLSGNTIYDAYSMSFTTGANTLNIGKVNLKDGETEAAVNTPIVIEFSSNITRGPNFDKIDMLDSGGNTVNFGIDETENIAVLTPSSNLKPSEIYMVYIPDGAYVNENNETNDNFRMQFTTAEYFNTYKSFTVSPSLNYLVNKPLTFDMEWLESAFSSDGYEITSFEWNFGDGQTIDDKNPEHTYSKAGDYHVILRLHDNKGFSYEYEQTVKIIEGANAVKLTVSPDKDEYLLKTKPSSFIQYTVDVSYNGIYLSGENVNVRLYKNGILQNDFGSVTTNSSGRAYFPFRYGIVNYYGEYELVFTYGSPDKGKVVRRPVFIDQEGAVTQPLAIQLYDRDKGEYVEPGKMQLFDKDKGKYIDYRGSITFKLNGDEKTGRWQKLGAGAEFGYVIDDVTEGIYQLELSNEFLNFYSVSQEAYVIHSSSGYTTETLFVKKKPTEHPILKSVKSSLTDSTAVEPTYFVDGVPAPPLQLEFDGNWNGHRIGYYEIKTDKIKKQTRFPGITLKPAIDIGVGSRVMVRMVAEDGMVSDWIDANMTAISKPDNTDVRFEDGHYTMSMPMGIGESIGGKIGILDGIPLLDNSKGFGFIDSNYLLEGVLDKDIKMELSFGGSLKYGKEKKVGLVSTGYDIEASMSGKMLLEYDWTSQKWYLEYGELLLLGDGSYTWKKSYTVPVVHIGVEPKLRMGAKVGGKIIFDREATDGQYAAIIYFAPHVKASIEASIRGASAEGYVEGNIPCEYHIPTGYMEVWPSIDVGIDGTLLGKEISIFHKTIYSEEWDNGKDKLPYEFNVNAIAPSEIDNPETGNDKVEIKPIPRNYLDRGSEWLPGNKAADAGRLDIMSSAKAGEANTESEIMKDNIYPDADVQLVQSGDELWMVWTDDNPDRSAGNRMQMMYSVLKDGTWSNPKWIGQDGSADFSHAAVSTINGVLMAWKNENKVLQDNAGIGEFVKGSEISVTEGAYRADGSNVQAINLTDDDKYDHSPTMAADGNNALLVWTKSEGLGIDLGEITEGCLSPENSDQLVFSSWDGSKWTAPAVIQDCLPMVVNSNLAMHGDEGLLLYVLDMDNDLATQEDQELFARVCDGGSWGEGMRITDNQVIDSNPKAVCSNGDWFITWYQDGNIMYMEGLGGKAKTQELLSKVQNNYEIVIRDGKDPQAALIYKKMGEDNTRALSAAFFDIEKGIWSDEIPLTEGEGFIRSFSPVFTGDGKLKIAYTQAEMVTEVIEEAEYQNPSDIVDLRMLAYTPVHDLALNNDDGLSLSNENPIPETTVTVTATIQNRGDFAENAAVYLYDGNPESGGKKLCEASTLQPVPARSSYQVELQWAVDSQVREKYDIYAVVQPDEGSVEIDKSNNMIKQAIISADVAVTDLECRNIANEDYEVRAEVSNNGSRLLENVTVQLDDVQSGKALKTWVLEQLEHGQEVVLTSIISSGGLPEDESGKINVRLTASLPDRVEESSLNNNILESVLEPSSITVGSMSIAPGETKVSVSQPLAFGFNMNAKQGDGFDQIRLENDALEAADILKELDGNTLKVTVKGEMDYDTRYTLIIPGNAIVGTGGQKMADAYSLSFVTESSSPEVIFAYPGSETEDANLNTELKVKYNQNVLQGPALENIKLSSKDSAIIPVSVSLKGEWMYIRPAKKLNKNTSYSLLIPAGGVQNDKAQVMGEDFSLSFKTGLDDGSQGDDDSQDDDGSHGGGGQNDEGPVPWDDEMHKTGVERISGQDRIETAIEIAKTMFGNDITNIILADAENYPDALAGSVLAYKLDAPILLVGRTEADMQKVLSYMKDSMGSDGTVYILGGTGAVSSDMEDKIIGAGFRKIKRLGGTDRYETSAGIAEELKAAPGTPVVLVSGENYPDALSVSSPAAVNGYPVLLVSKDSIPDAVMEEISTVNPARVYIIGLQGVVGTAVEDRIAETLFMDKANIVRIGGVDRLETSLETAKYFSLTGSIICAAACSNFPDALAGSIYAAKNNAPIILVDRTLSVSQISYLSNKKISGAVIFGGEGAVSEDVKKQLSQLLEQ